VGRFLNRVTQVLGNVFELEGSLSHLSNIDLATPIQPVYDLSRATGLAKSADFGSSLGFVGLRLTMNHTAAGIKFASAADLYTVEAEFFSVPKESIWIWVMDWGCYVSAGDEGDFGNAQLAIDDPDIQGTAEGANRGRLLATWNDVADNDPFNTGGEHPAREDEPLPRPYLAGPGFSVKVASTSTGTPNMNINVSIRLWVGARFTMPPGHA